MEKTTFDFGSGPVFAHQHANGGGWVADSARSDLEKLGRHFRERREARERGDVVEVESSRMLDERHDNE